MGHPMLQAFGEIDIVGPLPEPVVVKAGHARFRVQNSCILTTRMMPYEDIK